MKRYEIEKESWRDYAVRWQHQAAERCMSYGELAYASEFFTKIGKRYGLLREFKENGII